MNNLVRLTTQDVSKAIPVTDSKIIAEMTKREHPNIQRLINKYENDLNDFGKLGTEIRPLPSGQNETVFILNEMQATFLITLMRNTPEVLVFKKNLVKAFFFMKNELQSRIETRHIGISTRKSLTDTIKTKVDDGTNFKNFAYSNYSKLVYKKVLGETVKSFKDRKWLTKTDNVRNHMTIEQLEKVQEIESKIATYLEIRKDMGETDKQIYEEIKNHIS